MTSKPLRLAPPMRPWPSPKFSLDYFAFDDPAQLPQLPKRPSRGTLAFPLTEMIASDIRAHGVEWARSYHSGRGVPKRELDVFIAGATVLL